MNKQFNYKEAYTHAGSFHADDVFSAAFIQMIADKQNCIIPIHRVFSTEGIASDALVFDIGGGTYDHHQPDAVYRENGNKYAAFGLLWRDFAYILCSRKEVEEGIDSYFIQPLDLSDNYGYENSVAEIVRNFNFTWLEKEEYGGEDIDYLTDVQYEKAVTLARCILERVIEMEEAKAKAYSIVEEALANSDGDIVILDKQVPWKKVLIPSCAKFVVYKSSRGEWNAQVIPERENDVTAKLDFPEAWAGLRDEEIQKVSGINGLVFCHTSLFLCAASTKEGAINACKEAIRLASL